MSNIILLVWVLQEDLLCILHVQWIILTTIDGGNVNNQLFSCCSVHVLISPCGKRFTVYCRGRSTPRHQLSDDFCAKEMVVSG